MQLHSLWRSRRALTTGRFQERSLRRQLLSFALSSLMESLPRNLILHVLMAHFHR
jgi:hypothetical protein